VGGVPRPSILPHTARQAGATYIHFNILTYLVSAEFCQQTLSKSNFMDWCVQIGAYFVPERPSDVKLHQSLRHGAIYLVFIVFSNQSHVGWQRRVINSSELSTKVDGDSSTVHSRPTRLDSANRNYTLVLRRFGIVPASRIKPAA
jgi:hypothetical protein